LEGSLLISSFKDTSTATLHLVALRPRASVLSQLTPDPEDILCDFSEVNGGDRRSISLFPKEFSWK
jgi:hypothetical protein